MTTIMWLQFVLWILILVAQAGEVALATFMVRRSLALSPCFFEQPSRKNFSEASFEKSSAYLGKMYFAPIVGFPCVRGSPINSLLFSQTFFEH